MKVSKRLSSKSGITIPKQLREELGIRPGAAIDLEVSGRDLIIKRHTKTCRSCGSPEQVITVSGIDLCRNCAQNLVQEVQRHGIE